MSGSAERPSKKPARIILLAAGVLLSVGLLVLALGRVVFPLVVGPSPPTAAPDPLGKRLFLSPQSLAKGRRLEVWWDDLPGQALEGARPSGAQSNVRPSDYAGPEACQKCHAENYKAWSAHPHRWMNALADDETVKGDFSGVSISYRGGRATFYREDGEFRMRLDRNDVRRVYRITQTIGSRFFQYYVGRLTEGPEPSDHPFYHQDHVLFFGYWLGAKEWCPTVHVGPEKPDADRADPFEPPEAGPFYAEYASSCNHCHTTFALGDMLSRRPAQMGQHAPLPMHWSIRNYLQDAHPDALPSMVEAMRQGTRQNPMFSWDCAASRGDAWSELRSLPSRRAGARGEPGDETAEILPEQPVPVRGNGRQAAGFRPDA